ncbi:MAG: pantoate--beta-alanine ligase, partial [Anaerolineae bacterium]|nr:pantoate--beta-alanine ligase [Anaerolineae bacterium]
AEGVDLIWNPTTEIVYPSLFQTHVEVEQITRVLEGAARPGHFQGVTTVVSKLFNVFQPNRAYFGQKDAQQVAVIKRMVQDLNFNLDIVVCPIQREADGLAMSSRNVKLSPEAREQALCLHRALSRATAAYKEGERTGNKLRQMMIDEIEKASLARYDYVSVADPETLAELDTVGDKALFSLAVFVGGVRLIDNMIFP